MRRRTSLSVWLILGLVTILGTVPSILSQTRRGCRIDPDSRFQDGISIEHVDNPDVNTFRFTFEEAPPTSQSERRIPKQLW